MYVFFMIITQTISNQEEEEEICMADSETALYCNQGDERGFWGGNAT